MANKQVVFVPMGYALTLTANATSAGIYYQVANPGDISGDVVAILAGAIATIGPFNDPRFYAFESNSGDITYTLSSSGMYTAADEVLASGDVAGPSSSTDNTLPRFNLTTGKLIQGSGIVVDDSNNMTGITSIVANGNIGAGKSGTAGVLSSFPATSAKGSLKLVAVANTTDKTVTISNAAVNQDSVITIPDPAAATDAFVLKAANDIALAGKQAVVSGVSDAEIGYLDGVSSSIQTQIDTKAPLASPIFTTTALRSTVGNGTANTGTTAVEYGDGKRHTTVLTVATTFPAITGGADQAVGKLLYTFPAGAVIVRSAKLSLGITQTEAHINADTPDIGLGTVIGTGTVADLSGTTTFEDIITGQTAANCTGTATVKTIANQVLVIESGDAHTLHVNAAFGWAASGDAAALVAGTVVVDWELMA